VKVQATFASDSKMIEINNRLIRDPLERPTPREMLLHPWIMTIMTDGDHMARWIRAVWGWPKPSRKSRRNTGEDISMQFSK